MRQIRQEDLIKTDVKFVPSKPCEICGQPTRWAAVRCLSCLAALYLVEELAFTRDWLERHPGTILELGHDPQRTVHLAFLRDNMRNTGWCGLRVSQTRKNRTRVPSDQPDQWWNLLTANVVYDGRPPKICDRCWELFGEM